LKNKQIDENLASNKSVELLLLKKLFLFTKFIFLQRVACTNILEIHINFLGKKNINSKVLEKSVIAGVPRQKLKTGNLSLLIKNKVAEIVVFMCVA
jgi:hypothetical protein